MKGCAITLAMLLSAWALALLLSGCGGGSKSGSVDVVGSPAPVGKPETGIPVSVDQMPPPGDPLWVIPPDRSPLWQLIGPDPNVKT